MTISRAQEGPERVGRPDLLVFIPTYNERENVENIYRQIIRLDVGLDLLFVDDNSPDGTGEALDALAAADPRVLVIHRAGKLGVGSAHQVGIRHAYEHGYRRLLTMDCDFTHRPDAIPLFLAQPASMDIVVGSRFAHHDGVAEWNLLRKVLTRTAHLLTRRVLGMPYDATTAFRLYQLEAIDRRVFDLVLSRSYSFFFESLYLLCRSGARVTEVPIDLPRRAYGHSKMTIFDALQSIGMLVLLFARSLRARDSLTGMQERHRGVVARRGEPGARS